MKSSSRHMLSLCGIVVIALGARGRTQARPPGFVVLHFSRSTSGESASACRQQAQTSARARTLFSGYRKPDGELLSVTGHVAIRFKTSTSARQIDSLIAATGVEVFPSVERPGCRRYVLRVQRLEDEPTKIASVLQQSGLVDYATPDFSAGRPEGISSDSLFVDQVALRNAITKDDNTVDVAPATYGMGQVLSAYAGPLLRVGGATLSAQMSPPSSMSALDFVRSNGLTTLRLDIPEGSPVASVRVVLYSLDGTPVRQLVSEALEAGRYIVGWDGKDDRGRRVQPGVYVAVMTAGSFRETHRLVVR
jgi:hypothetical protein